MKILVGLLSIVGLVTNAAAQQSRLDSLQRLLADHPAEDARRVDLLIQFTRTSTHIDPYHAQDEADEAVGIARKLRDKTVTAVALMAGVALHQAQYRNLDEASLIEEAFTLDPSFGSDKERARAFLTKDLNEYLAGRAVSDHPLLFEALRLARSCDDKCTAAGCLHYLSFIWADDPVLADSCVRAAIALADRPGMRGDQANYYRSLGSELQDRGDLDSALFWFEQSSQAALKEDAWMEWVNGESTKGYLYWNMGNYPLAVNRLLAAIKTGARFDYPLAIAGYEDNLGCVYREMGDLESALPHFQRSYEVAIQENSPDLIIGCLNDLGLVDLERGDARSALEKFKEALRRCPEVELQVSKGELYFRLAEANRYVGRAKATLGDLDGAVEAFEAALRVDQESGDRMSLSTTRAAYADALRKADPPRLERATQLYEQAADSAKAGGWLNLQRDALKGLFEIHQQQGDAAGALRYLKEYMVVKDTLLSADKARAVSNLRIQYDTEKKEQQIVLLGKDKEVQTKEIQKQKLVRNGFMGGFALVALFAGVFFFQRNRISKEKARSEELLLNILPEEVAEELKAKGEADAKLIDHVTVLFTDFKGFTAMSEKLTPKELVRDIHECFSAFDHIMHKHNIEKIKTIGDAYMAAGGLPTPNTTHAPDVVKAALEIRDFIAEGKAQKLAAGLPYFEIRIGVHTGPVVAGIVGVKKFAYDIWGDTVNTASRMESSGEVGQVNISESTYALVKNEPGLSFTPRGRVLAKGKGEMEMYFVSTG